MSSNVYRMLMTVTVPAHVRRRARPRRTAGIPTSDVTRRSMAADGGHCRRRRVVRGALDGPASDGEETPLSLSRASVGIDAADENATDDGGRIWWTAAVGSGKRPHRALCRNMIGSRNEKNET